MAKRRAGGNGLTARPQTPRRKPKSAVKGIGGKVNTRVLFALADSGLSGPQIAKEMGVSGECVRGHLKRRAAKACQLVVTQEGAPVVQRQLNTIDQLNHINEEANRLLAAATAGIRAMEGLDLGVLGPLEALEAVKEVNAAKDVALKAMGEIRGQLKLQLEIFNQLFAADKAREFQEEVIAIMGEMDEELRSKFIARLEQRQSVRRAVRSN